MKKIIFSVAILVLSFGIFSAAHASSGTMHDAGVGGFNCVDHGAHEYQGSPTIPADTTFQTGGWYLSGTATTTFNSGVSLNSGTPSTNNSYNLIGYGVQQVFFTSAAGGATSFGNGFYFCMSGDTFPATIDWTDGLGGVSVDNLNVDLNYPLNSTSLFQHDFTAWNYVATSTASTTQTFHFEVFWGTSTSTIRDNVDVSRIYTFAPGATHYLSLPKSSALATSTIYFAEVCGYNEYSNSNSGSPAGCSDVITFKTGVSTAQVNTDNNGALTPYTYDPNDNTNYDCSASPLTDTYAGIPFLSGSFVEGVFCRAGNGFKDIGRGLSQFGSDFITGFMEETQNIFPISLIAHVNADIQSAQATTTDVSATINHSEFAIIPGTFTIYSSSTANWLEQKSGINYRAVLDKVFYLVTGLSMLAVAWAIVHKMHPGGGRTSMRT